MFDQENMIPASPFMKEFPEEGDVYLLKENGSPTQRINAGRMENSQYWQSHYRIIGVVLLLSFLFFVMTLLGETKIMEQAWQAFLAFTGQFMPQLPKLF